jgi:hypothetical protein
MHVQAGSPNDLAPALKRWKESFGSSVAHGLADSGALLRKQATLESQILNGNGTPIASEGELEATRRRLAAHPQALNAVLQTARALGRTPDTVSVQEVTVFGWAN